MPIDRKEVRHIADLSRLEIAPEELDAFVATFADIVAYVDRIVAVPIEGHEHITDTTFSEIILREDKVRPGLTVEEVMANAPRHEANLFTVPEVLKS